MATSARTTVFITRTSAFAACVREGGSEGGREGGMEGGREGGRGGREREVFVDVCFIFGMV